MAGLSQDDKLKFTTYFEEVVEESEDKNGELVLEDFERLLIKCGHRVAREVVMSLFTTTSGEDWKISLDEFLDFIARVAPSGSPECLAAELRRRFEERDVNKDGFVSFEELLLVVQESNTAVGEEQLRDFMKEYDTDGDGRFNFEEFVNMFVKTELLDVDADDDNEEEKKETDQAATALANIIVSADGISQLCHEKGLVEDGAVLVHDLRTVLEDVQVQMSAENLERTIQTLDQNGDGRICLDEFMSMFEDLATQETEENGELEQQASEPESEPEVLEAEVPQDELVEASEDKTLTISETHFEREEEVSKCRKSENEVTKLSAQFEGKKTKARAASCGDDGAKTECKGVGVKSLIAKWQK